MRIIGNSSVSGVTTKSLIGNSQLLCLYCVGMSRYDFCFCLHKEFSILYCINYKNYVIMLGVQNKLVCVLSLVNSTAVFSNLTYL